MKKPEEYADDLEHLSCPAVVQLIARVQRDAVQRCSDLFLESVHDKWTSDEAAAAIRAMLPEVTNEK